jgi:3-phosphoshikimate 1-carboxyvinyltransferase
MSHRLLICAGLSGGKSEIKNVTFSEDILATIDCLKTMGAQIDTDGDTVTVIGTPASREASGVYHCRESASTLRFFIPLAMLSEKISLFSGSERLMERPLSVYEKISREKNIPFRKDLDGITVGGCLVSGEYEVPGNISSQFVSGLLFALPLCDADSKITLTGNIESKSYIDMTLEAMKLFGVKAQWENDRTLFIKGNQQYESRCLMVEGDYSNAAFLDAFNYIGGNVEVDGLRESTLQGDSIYKEYFNLLRHGTPTLDIKNCPDLAPILMALACECNGCKLINTSRLRIKESDRGVVMAQELSKFGADITLKENEIIINKHKLYIPKDDLYCHNDHRVVMSLSVLASVYGGRLSGAEAVKKSFPDFFDRVKALGMEVELIDN